MNKEQDDVKVLEALEAILNKPATDTPKTVPGQQKSINMMQKWHNQQAKHAHGNNHQGGINPVAMRRKNRNFAGR